MQIKQIEIIEGDKISFIRNLEQKLKMGWGINNKSYSCLVLGGKLIYSVMIFKKENGN